jgi:hypothetical protein
MRPGQLEPNEFEIALLKGFAAQDPSLCLDSLHVLSREFTGVGSFTKFLCDGSGETKWDRDYTSVRLSPCRTCRAVSPRFCFAPEATRTS